MDLSISLLNLILIVGSILIALTIHEAMHAYTAHALGDDTAYQEGRLTLNPIAHVDPFTTVLLPTLLLFFGLPPILAARPVPFNPSRVKFDEFGAALVGVAGPLINLVLAIITALGLRILQPEVGTLPAQALLIFFQINVGVFIFNMLPIPPLDGSRVVYAVAPEPLRRVMEQIESFGILFILALLFLLLPVIGPILRELNLALTSFLL